MNYKHHLEACMVVAVFVTLLGLMRYNLSKGDIIELWKGFIPYSTIITCDLDSATSFVTKLWGPFKIIWKPFTEWGHREILHSWIYGPYILVGLWLLPALYLKIEVSGWVVIGAVLMIWTHVITDYVYSKYKKIIPKWIQKKLKKFKI